MGSRFTALVSLYNINESLSFALLFFQTLQAHAAAGDLVRVTYSRAGSILIYLTPLPSSHLGASYSISMESARMRFVALLGLALLGFACSHGYVDAQELSATAWLDGLASSSIDLEIEPSGGRVCDGRLGDCYDDEENEWMMESDVQGRLLRRVRYYISYGALAANRVPCSPRSGRSYYTRNCHRAGGPVNPYHRGCTAITRCRRYTN